MFYDLKCFLIFRYQVCNSYLYFPKNIIEHALSAGATLAKVAQKASWGGYSGYFKDLDGYLWEVAYNPFFGSGLKINNQKKGSGVRLFIPYN